MQTTRSAACSAYAPELRYSQREEPTNSPKARTNPSSSALDTRGVGLWKYAAQGCLDKCSRCPRKLLMMLVVVKPNTIATTQYRSSLAIETELEENSILCWIFRSVNRTTCLISEKSMPQWRRKFTGRDETTLSRLGIAREIISRFQIFN